VNPADLGDLERRRLRALVEADLALADQLRTDDFQLITPSGDSLSKESYLEQLASGKVDYLVWSPRRSRCWSPTPQGASAIGRRSRSLSAGTRSGPALYWHTDFDELRGGCCQVVWSQATRIIG
jgi:hypothetical protein